VIGSTAILDLVKFLHATQEHLALLSTMATWKQLVYYQAGR